MENQLIQPIVIPQLNQLAGSLKTLAPSDSEKEGVNSELSQTTQLITYTLIATALVGIFVYEYIKNSEVQ
jgi:hypothetical protein